MRRILEKLRRITPRSFWRAGGVFTFTLFSFAVGSLARATEPAAASTSPLPVDTLLQTAADFAFSVASAITKFIVILIDVMVPILTYNEFVNNPVVKAGWAITRDTVNMFFVVVLIIIAFGTIFGYKKFHWDQQVPRLLIFAIAINFSKTFIGIMIDFGQVIMLTFANALREIAAGNFIQLLGLNQLYAHSNTQGVLGAFDYFSSAIMSVVLVLWVAGTLAIFVGVLVVRIVGLWILTVVAPLTWFVGGAGDVIESKAYSDWWSKFKCLVGIGPIITFFLWLTLAVAGAGNIAANSGFEVTSGSNNAAVASEIFELDNLLSFFIAMMLLMAGLDAAMGFCGSVPGIAKALGAAKSGVLQKTAIGLAGRGAATGLKIGATGAYKGAGLALAGTKKYFPGGAAVARAWEKVPGRASMYGVLAAAGGATAVGKWATKKEGEARDRAGLARVARIKAEEDKLKNVSPDTVASLGEKFARGGAWSAAGEAEGMALLGKAMSDKQVQKQMRASGALKELWKRYGEKYEKDYKHDASKLDAVKGFKKSNADITGSVHLIDSWDDAKDLNDDVLKDKKVQDRLRQVKSNVRGKDGEMLNAYDAIEQGHAGVNKQKSIGSGEEEKYDRWSAAELRHADTEEIGTKGSNKALGKAIEATAGVDKKKASELISHMADRYKNVADRYKNETDEGKKNEMMNTMGNMMNMMDNTIAALATVAGGGAALKQLKNARASVELMSPTKPPEMQIGQTADAYASQYANASQARKSGAVKGLEAMNVSTQGEINKAEGEISRLVGQKHADISKDIGSLTDELTSAMQSAGADLDAQTEKLREKWQQAERRVKNLEKTPFASGKDKAEAARERDEAQAEFNDAKKRSSLAQDRKAAVEKDTRVVEVKAKIEAKTKEAADLNPDTVAGVKELADKIAQLTAHQAQINAAADKIEKMKTA